MYWRIWKLAKERPSEQSESVSGQCIKIKPVMGSTPEGTICQLDQARGMNKAIVKMVDNIVEVKGINSPRTRFLPFPIATVPKKANMLKEAIQEKLNPANIVVLDTAGVSSMYANDGGVIVAV